MHSSHLLRQFAKRQPRLTKGVLWALSRTYTLFPRKQHWLFEQITRDIGYRVPVLARLENGMAIQVPLNDVVGREIIDYGWYEPTTVSLISSALKPGSVFFDIGSHVGQYTLLASAVTGDRGSVHSFEADPFTYEWLCGNVRRNGLKNVFANNCAVAERCGRSTLYLSTPENIGANSLSPPINYSGTAVEVACTTMDTYIAEKHIAAVDLIKIDVEGAELNVLNGAKSLLGGQQRPRIVLEFSDVAQKRFNSSNAKLASFLNDAGYHLYRITESDLIPYGPRPSEASFFNVYAVPGECTQP